MDRKTFLKSLAVVGAALPCWSFAAPPVTGKCENAECMSDAAAVRQFLSDFLRKEEPNLGRDTLLKLMHERGRACCRALKFRQDLIEKSQGNVDRLVESMGEIVGPQNCIRTGNTVTLIYPVDKCICGWSPARSPIPDDPYCECSAANNQTLFETVSGGAVHVRVVDSPRRGGSHCRFDIRLA